MEQLKDDDLQAIRKWEVTEVVYFAITLGYFLLFVVVASFFSASLIVLTIMYVIMIGLALLSAEHSLSFKCPNCGAGRGIGVRHFHPPQCRSCGIPFR